MSEEMNINLMFKLQNLKTSGPSEVRELAEIVEALVANLNPNLVYEYQRWLASQSKRRGEVVLDE